MHQAMNLARAEGKLPGGVEETVRNAHASTLDWRTLLRRYMTDAARQSPTQTYVDLNRSGIALMEIVSKPDLRSAEEAGLYLRKVRTILRYLGTCDGNMEQGSMRCDVNISVRHPGDELGTRAEIKNINSVRFVHQAIEYETRRQIKEIEGGGDVALETRRFDPSAGVTTPMRSKEEAHDYRYFPDPDLLPLTFTQAFVDNIRDSLPELPDEKKVRFESEYGISASNAEVLVAERENGEFFEALVHSTAEKSGKSKRQVGQDCANIMITDLFGVLTSRRRYRGNASEAGPPPTGPIPGS